MFAWALVLPAAYSAWQPPEQQQEATKPQEQEEKSEKQGQKELEEKACGPEKQKFWTKLDKTQHPAPEAPPDKALIYVLDPQAPGNVLTRHQRDMESRVGVDGRWVGANFTGGYFFFTLEAGEHYFCSRGNVKRPWGGSMGTYVLVLTVEAGRTYYLTQRARGTVTHQTVYGPGSPPLSTTGYWFFPSLHVADEETAKKDLEKSHLTVFGERK